MGKYNNVTYSKGWIRPKKKRAQLYSENEARERFVNKQIYYATFEDSDSNVTKFIVHNEGFFYVGFLDNLQREYLKYQFNNSEDGTRFFLKEAQYWQYEGDTDKKVKTEIFQFTEQGDVTIHKVDIPTRQSEVLTTQKPIDVSMLYEDFPEFGEYDGLIKKERMDDLKLEI